MMESNLMPETSSPHIGWRLFRFVMNLPLVLRYLIAGGTGTALNLVMVYLLTDGLQIYYLLSTSIAFVISFFVSFTLQKFFTFQDHGMEEIKTQAPKYLTVALINMGLNAFFMYALVSGFGIHYLIAQIMTIAVISIESFVVYRYVIFKK